MTRYKNTDPPDPPESEPGGKKRKTHRSNETFPDDSMNTSSPNMIDTTGTSINSTTPTPDTQWIDPNGSNVIIKSTKNFSFRKLGPFWPAAQLRCFFGDKKFECETTFDGALIIKTHTDKETKRLLRLNTFCEQAVTVTLDSKRNSSRGLIYAPELIEMSEECILAGLEEENVTAVKRITSNKTGQQRKHTSSGIDFSYN